VTAYETDPFCVSLEKLLPLRKDSALVNNLMFIDGRLVIPNAQSIRKNLINKAHLRLGHLGSLKTLAELRLEFFWPQMNKDVENAVKECTVCQNTKAPTTAPAGKMLTPSLPHTPLTNIAINFFGPLPTSGH
jgi:hypothetical protein